MSLWCFFILSSWLLAQTHASSPALFVSSSGFDPTLSTFSFSCVRENFESLGDADHQKCFCNGWTKLQSMALTMEDIVCTENHQSPQEGSHFTLYQDVPALTNQIKSAVAIMKTDTIEGRIVFTRVDSEKVRMTGTITGLSPLGRHGIHVHTRGDLTEGCESKLGHYNPTNADNVSSREVGDLGILEADSEGKVEINKVDTLIRLAGPHNIVGRGVVIHEGPGGARLACAVIGILEEE